MNSTPTAPGGAPGQRAGGRVGSDVTELVGGREDALRRRSADSWSGRENAFETVIRLTPTRSAIVCRVTLATSSGYGGSTDGAARPVAPGPSGER